MDESKSWEERYKELEAHHIAETSFLIARTRSFVGQINSLLMKIGEFSEYESCKCSECRVDANSHGVDTWKTGENLENFVNGFFSDGR